MNYLSLQAYFNPTEVINDYRSYNKLESTT